MQQKFVQQHLQKCIFVAAGGHSSNISRQGGTAPLKLCRLSFCSLSGAATDRSPSEPLHILTVNVRMFIPLKLPSASRVNVTFVAYGLFAFQLGLLDAHGTCEDELFVFCIGARPSEFFLSDITLFCRTLAWQKNCLNRKLVSIG